MDNGSDFYFKIDDESKVKKDNCGGKGGNKYSHLILVHFGLNFLSIWLKNPQII